MEKRVAIHNLKLPKEIIAEILEYLYYTPQQVALREIYKRVRFYIKSSIYSTNYFEGYNYLFSHRHRTMCTCFCIKCGNYKYAYTDYRVMCKC